MTLLPNYHKDILDNPIQRIERTHLRRIRMSYFWRGVYAITILAMIAPVFWSFNIHFHRTLEVVLAVLIGLNIVSIFVVEMGIINQAADSIKREFQGKTWDLLILTGVDTWRLIIGKWLGVIRGNRRDIVFLYVLRMITVFWGMVLFYLRQDGFQYYYGYRTVPNYAYLTDIRIDLAGFVVIGAILAVYLLVEVMLVASLPIPFSLTKFTRKSAAWLGLGLRVGIPIAIGLFIHAWHFDFPYRFGGVDWWPQIIYSEEHRHFIFGLGTALMDSGYGLSAFVSGRDYMTNSWTPYIATQLGGLIVYLLWAFSMLRIAKTIAYFSNVSTPGFIPKLKPKREPSSQPTPTTMISPVTLVPTKPQLPQDNNLLGIQNPALYRCEVLRYDRESSSLEIGVYRMTDTQPVYQLAFSQVSFFTGLMRWTNAKFEVLNEGHLQQFADNLMLDHEKLPLGSKLYVVQSQNNRVRIIASDVSVTSLKTELH